MKPGGGARPVRMFVSYSHENAAWCKRLRPVLKVKANVDTLQPWHDTELNLKPGTAGTKRSGPNWSECTFSSAW
jgi:hypothetical protein